MSAYWISVYKEIVDEAKVAAYAELAGPALREAGGTYIARGLPELTYEVLVPFLGEAEAREQERRAAALGPTVS